MIDEPFTGSLIAMFSAGMASAEFNARSPQAWSSGQTISTWVEYQGHDCSPFKVYVRYGKGKIVLANIIGTGFREDERVVRKGRMPKIIEAASKVAPLIVVESVVSNHLATWLEGVGFTKPDPSWPTYQKEFPEQ